MIIKLQKYRNFFLQLLLLTYICGSFNNAFFEGIHIIMHLGDIIQTNYEHHNHHINNHPSDTYECKVAITHDHPILSSLHNSKNDNESTIINTFELDKIEYHIPLETYHVTKRELKRSLPLYICHITICYLNIYLPPPEVN